MMKKIKWETQDREWSLTNLWLLSRSRVISMLMTTLMDDDAADDHEDETGDDDDDNPR